ncbi:MAG: plasmid pRiA4b ORF-3 family protein [Bacteroidales bacterium]|jgi:hypothetical protein|nr:plasmid pRiA4b ORF-3 family protein [Bacteroidales bacterium]
MVFRFRLLSDENDDFYRDIDIKDGQTLYDFHLAIQKNLGYDNSQIATFYTTNEDWEKIQEFTLFEMDEKFESEAVVMDVALLSEFIKEEKQRLLYTFDQLMERSFFIELLDTFKESKDTEYPVCSDFFGDAPQQSMISQPEGGSGELESILGGDNLDDILNDPYLDDPDADDGITFENIDDYDL